MQWWRKENWLAAAEVIDALRVFPRMLIIAYAWWVYIVTGLIVRSYFALTDSGRTGEVTAFVTIVLPGIFGLAAFVFQSYSQGGRDWDKYRADTFAQGLPLRRPPDPPDRAV